MKRFHFLTFIRQASYPVCAGLTCLCLSLITQAQDTHYWTQQFGTRSALLGGAVVGGAHDNTAIYYNPAGLGFTDTGSISINGNFYRYQSYRIVNALGNQADFKSSDLGSVPLLISGMFRVKNPKVRIGYGILQPVDFNFNALARLDGQYPIIDDPQNPGNQEAIVQESTNSSVHEVTVALGFGLRLSEHWSIGLSNLFTGRSQSYVHAGLARVYLNDTARTLVAATVLQSFNYFHLRYSAKIGIGWQGDRFSAGATLTTPGLKIYGTGTVGADYTGTNILYNGTRQDVLADGLQPKLPSTYKYPLSVSAGFSWKFYRSTLAFSGQYFGSEAPYDMLRAAPADFIRPAGAFPELGADQFLRVKEAAKPVWNGVVGYEQALSSTVTLQGSFRNDMSYHDKGIDTVRGIKPDITTWNIYTFSIGTAIQKGKSLITIGITGSFGTDNAYAEQGNYSVPTDDNFLRGATTITKASFRSYGFILGYKYTFRKI
jgi:hypothetical protein